MQPQERRTLRSIQWLNFFLADVQTGLGPFLAAYLAAYGWNAGSVGYVLTFGGLVTVAMQTPAGAVVDSVHRKRALLAASLGMLVAGAILLMRGVHPWSIYTAQTLIGGAAPFLGPTVAAITLGLVGPAGFDRQFGKNQSYNSAGNVFAALLIAGASYEFGYHVIFIIAAALAVPAMISTFLIDPRQIDYARARGAGSRAAKPNPRASGHCCGTGCCWRFWSAHFSFTLPTPPCCPISAKCSQEGNRRTPLRSWPHASSSPSW